MGEPVHTAFPEKLDVRLDTCMLADAARLRRCIEALGRSADSRQWPALAAAVEASTARRAARAASVPETPVTADLPIAGQAEAIARAVADHPVTLVIGATGSGKITQLPKICLGAGRGIGAMNGRASHRCHDRTMKCPSFAEREGGAVVGKSILLVEDEADIREMVELALSRAGFEARVAADTTQARRAIEQARPDLVLLDWMLPGVSGLEFARKLRRHDSTRDIPIIMLTAKGEEGDRLSGFDAGADDYVVKPFSVKELTARIRAVLKRTAPDGDDDPIEIGGLRLDPVSYRVTAHSETIRIGPTEFRMLHFFMGHPERVFTRGQLLDRVWGSTVYIEERTVDVHIRRLRKTLAKHGFDRFVQTVHGTGYRFSRHAG